MKGTAHARRQALLRTVEGIAVGLVALNAVVYFAVYRPIRNAANRASAAYIATSRAIVRDRALLKALQSAKASLPKTRVEFSDFMKNHVPTRREGFSEAMRLVRKLSDDSGVPLDRVGYKLTTARKSPLDRLGIRFEARGSFRQIMDLIGDIETQRDLLAVRKFSFTRGENGQLGLQVSAVLYLTP